MPEAGQVMRYPPVHRERRFAPPLREQQGPRLDPATREAPSPSENKGEIARRIRTRTSFSVSSDFGRT